MTRLLRQFVERVEQLPPDVQDAMAASWLADLEGELRWDASLEASGERLAELAEEALEDERAGRTTPLDPDAL